MSHGVGEAQEVGLAQRTYTYAATAAETAATWTISREPTVRPFTRQFFSDHPLSANPFPG